MGPTASGKTALAIECARRFDGEIVSVDSALVYRGLDIGAAKPDAGERASAPHHLLDLREPWQPYSAAEFAVDARKAIAGIVARGKLPILAGGTGLYFHALLQGLSPMPEADPATRAGIEREAGERGWPAMHAELAMIDPSRGETHPRHRSATHPARAGGVSRQRPSDQRMACRSCTRPVAAARAQAGIGAR